MPPADDERPPQQPPSTALPASPRSAGPSRGRAEPGLQRRASTALFLALLSLFGLMGIDNLARGVYVIGVALLAGLAAIWFAATAASRARRLGSARPRGCATAAAIAGAGVVISTVLLTGFAVIGPQLSAYSRCLSGANTIEAQHACQHQFGNAVSTRFSGLGLSPGR